MQGSTIGAAARRLGLLADGTAPPRRATFDTVLTGDEGPALVEFTIRPDSPLVGSTLLGAGLPPGVLVVLLRRGGRSFMPQGTTMIEAGDELLIAAERAISSQLDALLSA
ncbi:MAG: TrkA C-terminal domain-containing protein [Ilumatobacteraceae bacterium]